MTILDKIKGGFQLRFKDRESAGNILGEALKDSIKKEDRKYCHVLGIPRGGAITAYYVAKKLGCPLTLIISRKLRAPHNDEIAIGAVTGDGTTYLNTRLAKELAVTSDYISQEKLHQLKEIERRISLYRPRKENVIGFRNMELRNKLIILVDDGAATGATLIAAIRCIKSARMASLIIIASPVAPKSTVELLKSEGVNSIQIVTSPTNIAFKSVEQYYADFHQVTDDEVIELMAKTSRI